MWRRALWWGRADAFKSRTFFFKMWESTNKATLYDMGKGVIFYVSSIAPTPVVGEAACHAGPGLPLNDVRTRPPFTCHQNSETVLFLNGTATPLLIFTDPYKLEWYFCLEEVPEGVADQKALKSRSFSSKCGSRQGIRSSWHGVVSIMFPLLHHQDKEILHIMLDKAYTKWCEIQASFYMAPRLWV